MGSDLSKKRLSEIKNEDEIIQNNIKIDKNYWENKNSNESPHEFDNIISEQDLLNVLIEEEEGKPCYRKVEIYEAFKEFENRLKYLSENKSNEIKATENRSARIARENTISKLRESRKIFFASLYKSQLNQYQINEINKRNISFKANSRYLESENKILQELKIENENNNYEIEINKYKSEDEKLKDENIKLDHLKNNLQNEVKELKYKVKNVELENNKYELEIKKYKSINEKLLCKSNKLEELNTNLLNKIEKLKNEINNLESKNKNLKAINENLEHFPKQTISISKTTEIESCKPLGFANPKGYCYLNSVVQVLGSCCDFKTDIYNYNWISTDRTNDSIFVKGLFNLIRAISECNEKNLEESLSIVQENITESCFGDDVYKCFMNILTRVSNVIKTNIERSTDHFTSLPLTLSEKAKTTFTRFKIRNPGFVFDNFYGQLTFQTVCKECHFVCNESFQMIKSLPLPVPKSSSSVTLTSCINMFFDESDVEVDEPMKCKCTNGSTISLKSISKLTHGPKYFFMYLNRGSYTNDGDKNNTRVTCDDLTVDIKTLQDQSIKYKLISVIDHIGTSFGGHYYCKCSFESEQWWLLNDSNVDVLKNRMNIVTDNTIVFLFKIIINSEE